VPHVPPHRRILGDNLRNLRKRAKLTQEKLAEKTGLSVVFFFAGKRMESGFD